MTGRVRDMIMDPNETGKLGEVIGEGGYYGMTTFDQSLFNHYTEGTISLEQALEASTTRTTSSCSLHRRVSAPTSVSHLYGKDKEDSPTMKTCKPAAQRSRGRQRASATRAASSARAGSASAPASRRHPLSQRRQRPSPNRRSSRGSGGPTRHPCRNAVPRIRLCRRRSVPRRSPRLRSSPWRRTTRVGVAARQRHPLTHPLTSPVKPWYDPRAALGDGDPLALWVQPDAARANLPRLPDRGDHLRQMDPPHHS